MRRTALLLGALAAGCAPPEAGMSPVELGLRVEAEVAEVEFGAPFELRVVRTWADDLAPEPFADASLAPLTVELLGAGVRRGGGRTEETRRYRARAFVRERAVVPPIDLRATRRGGGAPLAARGNELAIAVRSALPPPVPGVATQPEGPGDLLPLPRHHLVDTVLTLAGALLLLAAALWRGVRRRRPAAAPSAEPPAVVIAADAPPAHAVALAQLDALAAQVPDDRAAEVAFCTGLARVLRDYAAALLGRATATLTTEELLAASGLAALPPRALLAQGLGFCDLVKFACRRAPGDARVRLLTDARAFVAATSAASVGGPRSAEGRA